MSNTTWLRQYAAYGGPKGCSHEMADELKEAAAEIERLRTVELTAQAFVTWWDDASLDDDALGDDVITAMREALKEASK